MGNASVTHQNAQSRKGVHVTYQTEANRLLRTATKNCVVNHMPPAVQRFVSGKADLYGPLMQTVSAQREKLLEASPWLGLQSPWQQPTTRSYLQSKQPPGLPLVQPTPGLDWMVELSRYAVPYGSVGIIKSFEQYVRQGETILSSSDHWGDPFPLTLAIRWFLRLSPHHHLSNPWISIEGASAIPDYLPGIAYSDLSQSDDIWFPAASSAAGNVHFVVPGSYVLRLIAIVESSEEIAIAAKLAGSVQSDTNQEAQNMVRTTW